MRASLRAQFGLGPIGILLAAPLALLAFLFGALGFQMSLAAADFPPLLLLAAVEYAAAGSALFMVRRLQDAVLEMTS